MNNIPFETRQVVYKQAQHHFGNTNQTIVAIEELSELTKELCKMIRYPHEADIQCLAEEMADVTIMLEQLRQMYGINDEVCAWMDYKVLRLHKRIMEAQKNADE